MTFNSMILLITAFIKTFLSQKFEVFCIELQHFQQFLNFQSLHMLNTRSLFSSFFNNKRKTVLKQLILSIFTYIYFNMQGFTYYHVEKELTIHEFFRQSVYYECIDFTFLSQYKSLANSLGFQLLPDLSFDIFKIIRQIYSFLKFFSSRLIQKPYFRCNAGRQK